MGLRVGFNEGLRRGGAASSSGEVSCALEGAVMRTGDEYRGLLVVEMEYGERNCEKEERPNEEVEEK